MFDLAEEPCVMVSEEGLAFMVKSGLVPLRVALELRRVTARRTRMEMASNGMDRMALFFDIVYFRAIFWGNGDKPFFCTRQERSCTGCSPYRGSFLQSS